MDRIATHAIPALIALFSALAPGIVMAGEEKEPGLDAILSKLEAIEKRLASIEKKLAAFDKRLDALEEADSSPPMPAFQGFRARPARGYSDLKLPPSPTKEQAREYVRAIRDRTRGRSSWSSTDPEPRLLAQIGSDNLDILLEEMESSEGFHTPFQSYAVDAAGMIAGEKHRDLILNMLPVRKELVKVVISRGWEKQAREILLDELESSTGYLPSEWITAVVRLKDPSTYPALLEHFRISMNPHIVYSEIAGLSDMPAKDLDAAVADVWERIKEIERGSPFSHNRSYAAGIAAAHGHVDALGEMIFGLGRGDPFAGGSDVRVRVLSLIPFRGSNKQIQEWFEENKDKLTFDRARKKYILKEKDESREEEGF